MTDSGSAQKSNTPLRHGGGLAAYSIGHPVGVVMISLAVIMLGFFALNRLAIDLNPHIIYPEIRVRILDPGVPAAVMEDQVTRQLEEQLAITEDAISIQSSTGLGATSVDLSFAYGKDIDVALRDASTRLDRAKRFLPDTIDPPIIYKRDPSQIPVLELVVSSSLQDPVELRTWVDDVFRKWFLNLPGVAAAEVGGGLIREIQVLPDQQRLAGLGLSMQDLTDALERGNREDPTGRLQMSRQELPGKVSARFTTVDQIATLPIRLTDGSVLHLEELAQVIDTHRDERLRIRSDGVPGIKVSIQKQPSANTVAVVDVVKQRLQWLEQQKLLPEDVNISPVSDQSIYIRQALKNSALAAASGALLAMLVVYIFLGNLRRTLIIGTAIPIAMMVTFGIMAFGGLSLNIMTLGGLALGVGMLVDNTIVMLENIYRHQRLGEDAIHAGTSAAAEVNSAVVAATSTNLAAVLPFLFISGLTGLLFRELIVTISAAILASLVVAVTLVPALATRVKDTSIGLVRRTIDQAMNWLQGYYARLVSSVLRMPWLLIAIFVAALVPAVLNTFTEKEIFLPKLDDGRISFSILADSGTPLNEIDATTRRIEDMLRTQPEVVSVFTLVGGRIFGRTERETPNRSTIIVQLVPLSERDVSSGEWIRSIKKMIAKEKLVGVRVRIRQRGIRGIRTSRGDDDISIRVQGHDLDTLEKIAVQVVERIKGIDGLRNILHSLEEGHFELAVKVDRERASALGIEVEDISQALRVALEGVVVTDYLEGDRSYDVRVRVPKPEVDNPEELESVLLFAKSTKSEPVFLGSVAKVELVRSPAQIKRDNQQRIVEISASITGRAVLGQVSAQIQKALEDLELPKGYSIYEGGASKTLKEDSRMTQRLIYLALFLVFVVMAVQYESLRNPLVIILSVPFALIGVALGIQGWELTMSMPMKLGIIMLAGIVVNNAIVLVEYIEIMRDRGLSKLDAIVEAAKVRLRPILMTSLTTVVGMLPLALGIGEGAEMLQPLAVTIVSGLSFSILVSLLLVPSVYSLIHFGEALPQNKAASMVET